MSYKCVVFKYNSHSFQLAGQFEIINKEKWMNKKVKRNVLDIKKYD